MLTLEIRGSKQSEYLYEPDSFVPLAKLESATHIQRPEHKAIHPKKVASLFKTAQTDSEQKEAPAHASQAQEAIESEASVEAVKEKVKDFSVYYYHCDQIGAPQELTDEQGHIVWAAEYKVWGRTEPLRISATGTDDPDPHDLNRFWPGGPRELQARSTNTTQALNQVEQNLRFQGQYFDHESGLHYNRFRYYDPQTGRFVHQDPIGLLGGMNLFIYAPNPNVWLDPYGLNKWGVIFRKAGGGEPPCGMVRPHAHHIVFKKGIGSKMKSVLTESKSILEKYNIDWLYGKENLMWATNEGHTLENAKKVRDALKAADQKCKGCRPCMAEALQKAGKDIFLKD